MKKMIIETQKITSYKPVDEPIHEHTGNQFSSHISEDAKIQSHDQMEREDHGHSHIHSHTHTHPHKHTKAVLARLSRASGHLNSVRRMVEDGRDCSEVLIQLSAVIAALNNTGKVILKDHLENCIVDAVESGDKKPIEDLNRAIDRFMK